VIPVKPQPAPASFYEKVQQRGEAFLTKIPNPKDWAGHEYWKDIQKELRDAHSGICAYSCHWIGPCTGSNTVEHFKPKSVYPYFAYNWENYRLVCGKLNGRKGDYEDVLDPFTLQDGWLVIDFPSLIISPGLHLLPIEAKLVHKTIKRLRLNGEDLLEERLEYLRDHCVQDCPFLYLERKAPFLAHELRRQNLVETIREIMKF